jgi:hydrogenase expression/formation protein HypC
MCLGIPGQIVEFVHETRHLASVDVSGVRRTVNVGLVLPDGLQPGDWVLIHVGFAISKIDEEEARRTHEFLSQLGTQYEQELDELKRSDIQ